MLDNLYPTYVMVGFIFLHFFFFSILSNMNMLFIQIAFKSEIWCYNS